MQRKQVAGKMQISKTKVLLQCAANRTFNTWRGQQKNRSESISMQTGVTHGPNV